MPKTISDKTKKAFLEFCRERLLIGGGFTTSEFAPFNKTKRDGEPAWEFHAANYTPDSFDIYELLASVSELTGGKLVVEVHGYDEFYVVEQEGAENEVFGKVTFEQALYVLRGASEALDNFYYGHMPAEDQNDADGGDVDALEAVRAATIEYYS